LLRTHINRSSNSEPGLSQSIAAGNVEGPGNAEVRQNRLPLGEQDILGFDIAMDDPLPVGVVQCVGYLARDSDGLVYR